MPAPQQFTLALDHPHEQRLDNFVPGENTELVAALDGPSRDFEGYWILGAPSSGRSHLLRGACLRAADMGLTNCYIGCAEFAGDGAALAASLSHAGRFGQVVAIDDVNRIAGSARLEELLMAIYQRLLHDNGRLLVAHTQAAQQLDFLTPDLGSRMRSLQHFLIKPLTDENKARLLAERARSRGYELARPVLDYWLARGPRDLGALLTDLERLDKASLARQQRVTVPLLKQVLGY